MIAAIPTALNYSEPTLFFFKFQPQHQITVILSVSLFTFWCYVKEEAQPNEKWAGPFGFMYSKTTTMVTDSENEDE